MPNKNATTVKIVFPNSEGRNELGTTNSSIINIIADIKNIFRVFMIKKFSSPKMRNREFVFTPKIEYELVAESANSADKLREENQNSLTFPFWCPRQESNLDHELRKLAFYPLNYRGRGHGGQISIASSTLEYILRVTGKLGKL